VKLAEPPSADNNILSGRNHAFFMPNGGYLGAGHNDQWGLVRDSSVSPANTWLHVAVTYDSQTRVICLYRDGLLVSQASNVPPFEPSDRTLQIGSHNSLFLFKGQMTEARVWNKVLSQTEIQSHLSHRLVGNEPGLVAYWPLNEGAGATVKDQTKNANHGTIAGNAVWVQAEIPIKDKQQPQPQPDTQEKPVVVIEEQPKNTQEQPVVVIKEKPKDMPEQPVVVIKEHSELAVIEQPQEQPKKRTYPYRILSIDGGGIRGIIPAMILAEIEKRTQKPISSLFDLIAGTSTGGILALGLTKPKSTPDADGQTPEHREPAYSALALVSMFAEHGSEIFYEPLIEEILGGIDDIIKPKYTSEGREEILKKFFGATPMKDTLKEVFITSYDIELRTPVFFTSNVIKQNLRSRSFRRICRGFTMKQAAMATSAAPTYFSPYRIQTSQSPSSFYTLVDGGVFANNPSSLALMEALNNAKEAAKKGEQPWTLNDVLVVSLGTGSLTKVYPYNEAKNWGLLGWVRPILNIILDGSSESVSCELEQLLSRASDQPNRQYYRFQAYLDERLEPMDNAKAENIRQLIRVAKQIIEEREDDIDNLCSELMS
jgi:uncharacterized protein